MSPRWLFFPTQTSVDSFKVRAAGTISVVSTSGWSAGYGTTNASGYTLTGTDDVQNNYQRYPHGSDIRPSSGGKVRFLLGIKSSGDYSGSGAWSTAVNAAGINVSNCEVVLDGTDYPVTAMSIDQWGSYFTIGTTAATAYFSNLAAGSTFSFTIDWG